MKRLFLFLSSVFCVCNFAVADDCVLLVIDAKTKEPIISAQVTNLKKNPDTGAFDDPEGRGKGFVTDFDGKICIRSDIDKNIMNEIKWLVNIYYVGYEPQLDIRLEQGVLKTVEMTESEDRLPETIVGRREVDCEGLIENDPDAVALWFPHATALSKGDGPGYVDCKIEECEDSYVPLKFDVIPDGVRTKWVCVENYNVRVIDNETEEPVANAVISNDSGHGTNIQCYTNADGSLSDNCNRNAIYGGKILVVHDGYEQKHVQLEINPEDPSFVNVIRLKKDPIVRISIPVVNTIPVIKKDNGQSLKKAVSAVDSWILGLESNKSKWKDVSGNFNTARLASDLTAGVVLGTVGGVVSGVVIKKKQVEKGFESLGCYVGGQKMADWKDEFKVEFHRY